MQSKELAFKEMEHSGKVEVRLSHRNLAEYMGLRQDNVRTLIEEDIASFEQISPCPVVQEMVETGSGAQRETKVIYLDSDQANYLIGPHKGETFIVQWLWQDNKTLRDIVEQAVTAFLTAKAPVPKKRPWERA